MDVVERLTLEAAQADTMIATEQLDNSSRIER
jgi:hypothetical protein